MVDGLNCNNCNAQCCRYVATEIDEPEKKEDFENILWYLLHKNVEVFVEDGGWYIQFLTPCKALDKKGVCTIYSKRPEICKELSIKNCERHGKGDPYGMIFKEPEELIEYMEEEGIETRDLGLKR